MSSRPANINEMDMCGLDIELSPELGDCTSDCPPERNRSPRVQQRSHAVPKQFAGARGSGRHLGDGWRFGGTAPNYLVRDNDHAYGQGHRVRSMGIRDHPISLRPPWQTPMLSALIGTIRRDCLDRPDLR